MESLGKYLQRVRKEKEVSFEEIVSRTKINPIYLKALEADDLSEVPNRVFAKGFLRSYLRTLSIDEKEVLERYESFICESFQSPGESMVSSDCVSKSPVPSNNTSLYRFLGFAGVSGVVVLVLSIYVIKDQEAVRGPNPLPQEETRFSNSVQETKAYQPSLTSLDAVSLENEGRFESEHPEINQEVVPKPVDPKKAQVTGVDPTTESPMTASVEKPLTLFIEAFEQSWVVILVDDDVLKEVTLKEGERYTLRAERKFLVTLGNAGGVHMELNGEALGPYGDLGQVVRDILIEGKGKETEEEEESLTSSLQKKKFPFKGVHKRTPA